MRGLLDGDSGVGAVSGDHGCDSGEFSGDSVFGGESELPECFLTHEDVFFATGIVHDDGGCGGGLDDKFRHRGAVFFPFDAKDFFATSSAGEGINACHSTESCLLEGVDIRDDLGIECQRASGPTRGLVAIRIAGVVGR